MRDHCQKGIPCKNTCIFAGFRCRLNLDQRMYDPLQTVSSRISNLRRKPRTILEIRKEVEGHLKNLEREHRDWVDLRKKSLLTSQERLKISQKEAEIAELRGKAINATKGLPAAERKSVQRLIGNREAGSKTLGMSREDKINALRSLVQDVTERVRKGDNHDDLEKAALIIASTLPKNLARTEIVPLERALNKLPDIGISPLATTFGQISARGAEIVKEHPEIKSSMSIIGKYSRLHDQLQIRLVNPLLSKAKRQKLEETLYLIEDRKIRAERKLFTALATIQSKMFETSLSKAQVTELMNRVKIYEGRGAASIRRDMRDFIIMFNGKGFYTSEGVTSQGIIPVQRIESTSGRASANSKTGTIRLNAGASSVNFHEFAHMLEASMGGLQREIRKWRDSRALEKPRGFALPVGSIDGVDGRKLPTFRLSDLDPARGFDNREVAVAGKFMSPYMGKVYPQGSTEVLSMAIQQFYSPNTMLPLYANHPDLFNLVVGLSQV